MGAGDPLEDDGMDDLGSEPLGDDGLDGDLTDGDLSDEALDEEVLGADSARPLPADERESVEADLRDLKGMRVAFETQGAKAGSCIRGSPVCSMCSRLSLSSSHPK